MLQVGKEGVPAVAVQVQREVEGRYRVASSSHGLSRVTQLTTACSSIQSESLASPSTNVRLVPDPTWRK